MPKGKHKAFEGETELEDAAKQMAKKRQIKRTCVFVLAEEVHLCLNVEFSVCVFVHT